MLVPSRQEPFVLGAGGIALCIGRFSRDVDALRQLLGRKKLMGVDEMRRNIEATPEAEYLRLSYYRKWMRGITRHLLATGVITEAELRTALEKA